MTASMEANSMTQARLSDGDRSLRIDHLSKTFPGQQALRDVTFEVRSGQIVALCGENGSGKSTLVKILAGYHAPDPGSSATLDGQQIDLDEASRSGGHWRHRLHFIHQDLALVDSLNTVENLALGRGYQTGRGGRIRWRSEEYRARALLREFEVDFDVLQPVGTLRAADRALVAVIRALQDWDRDVWNVLVLDEPTASLPSHEVAILFAAIRRVAARGAGVVFVSHRLQEVFDVATTATVLRNGRWVGCRDIADLGHDQLVEMIVGRPVEDLYTSPPEARKDVVLAAQGLVGKVIDDVSLTVHAGEMLGVAGLTGSGRDELPMLLFGATPLFAGTVAVDGLEIDLRSPRAALAAGLALVPANRATDGAIPDQSVRENVTLPRLGPLFRGGRLRGRAERRELAHWVERFDIRPTDPERKLVNLSGGNQQKVVLAKWMRTEPRVLVLDQPTQGVDVGARAQIYELLAAAAQGGVAVIVCSAEASELANICERVLVLRDGRVAATLAGADVTEDRILAETLGVRVPRAADHEPSDSSAVRTP